MSKPTQENEDKAGPVEQGAHTDDQQDTGAAQSNETIGLEGESSEEELNVEQFKERLSEANLSAERAQDDLLRVKAEMQNLRRRTEQDVEKAHKYGIEKFSTELLGVIDNLERALLAAKEHEDESSKAIHDGVSLTLKSFNDCFAKFSIEAVDPIGEPFNPQLHQAIATQESPDSEPNSVIEVVQKGYTLNGRVIRPAMVMVSKG